MRGKSMVALGRIVLAKRECVIMLQQWDKGLVRTTLRYPHVDALKRSISEGKREPAGSRRREVWPRAK